MAVAEQISRPDKVIDYAARRRARITGGVLIAIATVLALLFSGADGDATFRLSRPNDPLALPDLIVPSLPFIYLASAIMAFAGARLFLRGGGRWTSLVLALALSLAVCSFLVWATAGKAFSLTGMLQATVVRAVPIAFGGLAALFCERVAVVNIAVEGMLLAGAFTGALMGSLIGGWGGLAAAVMVGGLFGFILAALVVTYRMDQVIAGVVINLFVVGLTSYVSAQVFTEVRSLNNAPVFRAWSVPLLSEIPVIGPMLFQQNLFVYAAMILVVISTYYFFKTRNGLRARAVGEHPKAADTLGIDVYWTRYVHVTIGGMIAGFGGAWFTLGSVGRFDDNMTGGRGFIGIAALIFGRWHPVGVLAAALVFGFTDSLQQKLALLQTPIPSEFLAMAPYIATIIVVAGLVGRARPPAASGRPYIKE